MDIASCRSSDLRGKRVLITGGAGFIGSRIADLALASSAAEVVVLDNFSRGSEANLAAASASKRLRIHPGDIRDTGAVAGACAGIDVLMHLAALRLPLCSADPRLAMEVMVSGTETVLREAARARVGRVVAASSAAVYGTAGKVPTPEHHSLAGADTMYGVAKACNEAFLRCLHRSDGIDYVALRYFNVYGPRMATTGPHLEVLAQWLKAIRSGTPPVIFGTGEQTTDFVYVDDVAHATLLAATCETTDVAINVGTGVETSLFDLAKGLLAAAGSALQPKLSSQTPVNDVSRRCADTALARRLLGFRAGVRLDDGLERLVDWFDQTAARPACSIPR